MASDNDDEIRNEEIDDENDDDDDDDDEDEDEDDEEDGDAENDEDDDEDEEARRSRKRRRKGASIFIEDEVSEGSDDEEDYDDDGDLPERAEAEREALQLERRAQRQRDLTRQKTAEEEVEYFERRYVERDMLHMDSNEAAQPRAIRQVGKLPTVRDPKLWMVKCQLGREKEVAVALMRKYLELEYSEEPLQIKGCMALENLKGHIYVEAFRQAHVQQAINGLQALRMGQYKQYLVPIEEMTTLMACVRKVEMVPTGAWVRLKRPFLYRDDIAQVEHCDETRGTVTVLLVPRLDYEAMGTRLSKEDIIKRSRGGGLMPGQKRPAQRLFEADEVRQAGGEVQKKGTTLIYERQKYRDGYLLKTVPINALVVDGVQPTLDELRKFNANSEAIGETNKVTLAPFQKGELVMVVQGELANLIGVVESVTADNVNVLPQLKEIANQIYSFKPSELKRYFRTGDHVKVISGVHEGETGLIVRVEDSRVVLFCDTSMEEIEVLNKDVQLALEVSTGIDSLGQFALYDLVQLNAYTVGVIVKIERDGLTIIDQQGSLKRAKSQEVTPKKAFRNAVCLDAGRNAVHVGDVINVIEGQGQGRKATVKYIYRATLFLHSPEQVDNGGVFTARAKQCMIAGAKSGPMAYGMSPSMSQSPRPFGFGGGRGRGRGRNPLMHQTVQIRAGPHKGLIGIVRETTDTSARVELHSKTMTVTVELQKLVVRNKDGSRINNSTNGNLGATSNVVPPPGSQTPYAGSQTPAYGAMTPGPEGSMTPSTASAWDPSNVNTPGNPATPGSEFAFEETPGREIYGMTEIPATPGGYAYMPSTPDVYTPTTPGGYNPATPGLDSQTTPGAYNPLTPNIFNPNTPGGI